MKVVLSITAEIGVDDILFLTIIEKMFLFYFARRNCGEDIKELHIHVYCLNRKKEGYENFWLPRKAAYKQLFKNKTIKKR